MKKKVILSLLLSMCMIVCATRTLNIEGLTAYATDTSSGDTQTGADSGKTEGTNTGNTSDTGNTGGEEETDPIAPPITLDPPVAEPPALPTCSLKSFKLLTTEATSIIIYNSDINIEVEYALVQRGAKVTDTNWKSVPDSNTIEIRNQGSYDLYYRAKDKTTGAMSETSNKYEIFYDRTAPRAPRIETYKDVRNQRLSIEVTAQEDTGSAIEDIYYRIDGGTWRRYSQSSVYLTYEGNYSIETYCVDECGNESSITKQTINFTYKDLMVLPTVTMLDKSPTSGSIRFKMNNSYTNMYDYQYKFVKKGSRAGNTDWLDCTQNTVMTINTEGEWELYIQVLYENESINGSVASCSIDRTGPNILGTSEYNNSTNNVSIMIDAKDSISRDLKYSFDKGKTWTSSNSKTYKVGDKIQIGDIQVKDSCDNITYVDISGDIIQETNNKNKIATLKEYEIYPLKTGISINNTARTQGYVSGYGGGKFGPDDKVSRCQLAAIFNRVFDFTLNNQSQIKTYNDVATTHWAYNNIRNIQAFNMLDTVGNNFNPDGTVSRAEMAHAICQFLNLEVVDTNTNIFDDIDGNKYKNDIIAVAKIGLVAGYGNNKFGPDDSLTRAQVVTIVNRMLGIDDISTSYNRDFVDVPKTHWAYYDIVKASI